MTPFRPRQRLLAATVSAAAVLVALPVLGTPTVAHAAAGDLTITAAATQSANSESYLESPAGPGMWCSSEGVTSGGSIPNQDEDGTIKPIIYPAAAFPQHLYNPWLGFGEVRATATNATGSDMTATVSIDVADLLAQDPTLSFSASIGSTGDEATPVGANLIWTGTLPDGDTDILVRFTSATPREELAVAPVAVNATVPVTVTDPDGVVNTTTVTFASEKLEWKHTPYVYVDPTSKLVTEWYFEVLGAVPPTYGPRDAFGYWYNSDDENCMAIPTKISVGNRVWADTNGDGRQADDEDGITGVTLVLTGPDGKQVTDVNGNLVEPMVTDESGVYSFDNLPRLEDGEGTYTVAVDVAASGDALKGLAATLAGVGDTAGDSSTGSESTNGRYDDRTLDFGFVLAPEPTPTPTPTPEPTPTPTPTPEPTPTPTVTPAPEPTLPPTEVISGIAASPAEGTMLAGAGGLLLIGVGGGIATTLNRAKRRPLLTDEGEEDSE